VALCNQVNAEYDASYSYTFNTNKSLGRSLILGQACGIIGMALYGSDIPLEKSGIYLHVYQIVQIKHNLHILHILISPHCIFPLAGRNDGIIIFNQLRIML
jgi:hypothetical protein